MVDICSRSLSLKERVVLALTISVGFKKKKKRNTSTFLVNKRCYLVRPFCIFMIVIQLQPFSTH